MVYCIGGIDFDAFLQRYAVLLGRGDELILVRNVLGRLDLQEEADGASDLLERICLLSRDKSITVYFAFRALLGDDWYNSVGVVDCGEVLGVSDQIIAPDGYCAGKSARAYETCRGNVAVLLGDDVAQSRLRQPWEGKVAHGVCLFHTPCEKRLLLCARVWAIELGAAVHAHFIDSSYLLMPDGAISASECGQLRAFFKPLPVPKTPAALPRVRFTLNRK